MELDLSGHQRSANGTCSPSLLQMMRSFTHGSYPGACRVFVPGRRTDTTRAKCFIGRRTLHQNSLARHV